MMFAVLPLTNHNKEHDFGEILEPIEKKKVYMRRIKFNNNT